MAVLCIMLCTSLSAQDLTSCSPPYIIDLSVGYKFGGYGKSGCGCSPTVDNCERVDIILRRTKDGNTELLECSNISLTERWWREKEDYVSIYNPITCEEYPSSDTHNDRFEFNTSALQAGDTLSLLICKNDPFNNNIIELRAYAGPDCQEGQCVPMIDCPATFKLRKNLECHYELPDFTTGIILTDTCQVPPMLVSEEYFIIQNPPAGTFIEDSVFVEITVLDQGRNFVTSCDVFVTLAEEPPLEMDDPDPIDDIVHGDYLPDFQVILAYDTLHDNTIRQYPVKPIIDDYVAAPCEGYMITYRWTAVDTCGNTITKAQSFNVLADTVKPIFASVPIDLDTILSGQPLPPLVDLVAVNQDGSNDGITLSKSIDEYQQDLCRGYNVTYRWKAIDECGNTNELTKTFFIKPVNDPPIFIESPTVIPDICYGDSLPAPQVIRAANSKGDTTGVVVTHHIEPYIENPCAPFPIKYVWTATDTCNNTATTSTTFMVTPKDADLSNIQKIQDLVIVLDEACQQRAAIALPVEIDRYGDLGISISIHDDQWNKIDEINDGSPLEYTFGSGISYLIYHYVHQCGATIQDTAAVTTVDNRAPEIMCQEDFNLLVQNMSACTAVADWSIPQATDNCHLSSVTQISGPERGSVLDVGTYMVSYMATDSSGNRDTCSFAIHVLPFTEENFNCKEVTVDLDENCEAWLDMSTIIDQNKTNCMHDLEAVIIIGSDTLRSERVNLSAYQGQHIKYNLCDKTSGICCSADITIKDRHAPVLMCTDSVYVSCILDADDYRPDVISECSDIRWIISDEDLKESCENDSVKSVLTRTFRAEDDQGNISEPCTQKILILYADINDQYDKGKLKFPADTTITCDDYDFENLTSSIGGQPTLEGIIIRADGNNRCGLTATFKDELIKGTGCEKIVRRNWFIREPKCKGEIIEIRHAQIIKIIDKTAPVLHLQKNRYVIGVDNNTCHGTWEIPKFDGSDNCSSNLQYNIFFAGYRHDDYGTLDIPVGENKILVRVGDECNNYGYDTITVIVKDPTIPVSICLEHTNVSLSGSEVRVYAIDIDGGSYDNCQLEKIEIKRAPTTCSIEDSYYKDFVSFCCEDLNAPVQVFIKATDISGNTNFCTAYVKVVDKSAPTISIPPDLTIDCNFEITKRDPDDPYGHLFGTPSPHENRALNIPDRFILEASGPLTAGIIEDNCPEEITLIIDTDSDVNNCGIGVIRRTFTTVDPSGNRSQPRTQTIKITGGLTLDTSLIQWPRLDTTIVQCTAIEDIDPDILGKPVIKDAPCALYGIGYEDTYFEIRGDRDGACAKMTRKWTVINWCDPDINNKVSKTQVLKLVDNENPEFLKCHSERYILGSGESCETAKITLFQEATDNCTSIQHLMWTATIDKNTPQEISNRQLPKDSIGRAVLDISLSLGRHTVQWEVQDQCGNITTCNETIIIDNNKPPTPYAIGLTTSISFDGTVEIWASDLQVKAEHPCYSNTQIAIGIQGEGFENASDVLRLTCDNVGVTFVDVYAYRALLDGSFAYDFTTVTVELQDNFETCNSINNPATSEGITGTVATTLGVALAASSISIQDMHTYKITRQTADATGSFAFNNIPTKRDYKINAQLNDKHSSGVSTRDIILLQQHLMGINTFNTHWKMLQADVNQDQKVTSIDIVELRKLIVGIESKMLDFEPWKFFNKNLRFNPLDYGKTLNVQEGVLVSEMSQSVRANLIGIKMGDIDQSAVVSGDMATTRSTDIYPLYVNDILLEANVPATVSIALPPITTMGWQFDLAVDDHVKIIDYASSYAELGIIELVDRHLYASISSGEEIIIQDSDHIMTLTLRSDRDMPLREAIALHINKIRPEIYSDSLSIHRLQLEFRDRPTSATLSMAHPNPLRDRTRMSYHSPAKEVIVIEIFNINGRSLHRQELACHEGVNEIQLLRSQFPASGLYLIRITSATQSYSRRLVVAD